MSLKTYFQFLFSYITHRRPQCSLLHVSKMKALSLCFPLPKEWVLKTAMRRPNVKYVPVHPRLYWYPSTHFSHIRVLSDGNDFQTKWFDSSSEPLIQRCASLVTGLLGQWFSKCGLQVSSISFMQILGSTPDLLNQKLCGGLVINDSNVSQHLRATALNVLVCIYIYSL